MNPLAAILKIFKKKENGTSQVDQNWCYGFDSFRKGNDLYVQKQSSEALGFFDKAIKFGFVEEGVYGTRGSCLQLLGFDLDAIDDFTKAIELGPNNCNLYYMRSVSRGATGDLLGRVSDLNEAIRLATVPSAINKIYDEWAQELGYKGVVDYFKIEILFAHIDLNRQATEEKFLREYPGRTDLIDTVSRRRAKSKRRAPHETK